MTFAMTLYMDGGSTSKSLMSGGYQVMQYAPNIAPDNEDRVTDTIQLKISAASIASLQASISALSLYLANASEFSASGINAPTYVGCQPDGAAAMFFSKIYSGYLTYDQNALSLEFWTNNKTVLISLTIERDNWWIDGGAQITFVNLNTPGGDPTGLIYNCNDLTGTAPTKKMNYVKLPAAQVTGNLPAYLSLTYLDSMVLDSTARLWISGSDARDGLGYQANTLEAESASGASATVDAQCSNGNKVVKSLTTDAETILLTWTNLVIPSTHIYCHIMARFADNTNLGDVRFRLKVQSGGIDIWTGQQFELSSPTSIIQDLGVVQLPPTLISNTYFDLCITAQRKTTGTKTISVDFIQIFPARNFTYLEGVTPLYQNDSVTVGWDSTTRAPIVYRTSSGHMYTDWFLRGSTALTAYPGKDNYYAVLVEAGTSGTAEISRSGHITGYIFNRKRAL